MPTRPFTLFAFVLVIATAGDARAAPAESGAGGTFWMPTPPKTGGTSIIAAGQAFDVGRPVVLWSDPEGFNGYNTRCIDQSGGCCDHESPRYAARKGIDKGTLDELRANIYQFVLHFDGCVNSRSCFKSMHNRTRKEGSTGCGLSAHFMIDADGTIYQTMDLVERAMHAEQSNSVSVGVEICNRGRVDVGEMSRLPAEYRTRPRREVVINGSKYLAYDFRPEQYESIIAVTRTLLKLFPRIKPVIPVAPDGRPLLDTLPDPLAFEGIVGHLHVDKDMQKWDPGALDWERILKALNGFQFPVQVRSFLEVPRTIDDLRAARRAAFYDAEERATGYFPMASARLWHSGVHLRGSPGAPVHAPTRGRVMAVRRGEHNGSSTSFVLIRHDLNVDGEDVTFYSLLAHLNLPSAIVESAVPWLRSLARPESAAARAAYENGRIVLLDERIEAGDLLGFVGLASRGPEQGPEVHFEIFTADRLPGDLGRRFRYVNAAADGALVRREGIIKMIDRNHDDEVDGAELAQFFRTGDIDDRQALRRLAVRHQHEWGDRNTWADFSAARELAALPESDRRRLYDIAINPYVFWSDALAAHMGLPENQIVVSYNPITFLLEIAARSNKVDLDWARGSVLSDDAAEPRKLARVPIADWTNPALSPIETPLFGPPVGMRLGPKKKADIPLIELAPTDERR